MAFRGLSPIFAPKTPPRRLRDASKMRSRRPRRRRDASKTPPRCPQDAPRSPQGAPKTPPRRFQDAHDALHFRVSRDISKNDRRYFKKYRCKTLPRRFRDASKPYSSAKAQLKLQLNQRIGGEATMQGRGGDKSTPLVQGIVGIYYSKNLRLSSTRSEAKGLGGLRKASCKRAGVFL